MREPRSEQRTSPPEGPHSSSFPPTTLSLLTQVEAFIVPAYLSEMGYCGYGSFQVGQTVCMQGWKMKGRGGIAEGYGGSIFGCTMHPADEHACRLIPLTELGINCRSCPAGSPIRATNPATKPWLRRCS